MASSTCTSPRCREVPVGAVSPRPTGGGRTAKFARLNQLELYYETLSTGQPLVLIHGSLMTVSLLND